MAIAVHKVDWMVSLRAHGAESKNAFPMVFETECSVTELVNALRCLRDWGVRAPRGSVHWWCAVPHLMQAPILWTLLSDMGADFEVQDEQGNTWLHEWIKKHPETIDAIAHLPMVNTASINQPNRRGETPLNLVLNSNQHRLPKWMRSIVKEQPSLFDEMHPRCELSLADWWISKAMGSESYAISISGMHVLTHMVSLGWRPPVRTMVPILKAAIEEHNERIVKTLVSIGGSALVNTPLNSAGCPPLMRALYWLGRAYAARTHWLYRLKPVDSRYSGVFVALLQGNADLDVSIGGMQPYALLCRMGIQNDILWDP